MHFKISTYNELFVTLFLGNLLVWFKSFTNLELGVREFWQLFLTHIFKSRVCFRFCHGIAKGRDCKVEFIQLCVGFILCQIFL